MASLWTPEGEHRVQPEASPSPPTGAAPEAPTQAGGAGDDGDSPPDPRALEELAELERQLLAAPAADVIANHCYGFFQLAALHLSQLPPRLEEARVAIDALAAVVESLDSRLGRSAPTLRDGLAQLRLAFVQIAGAAQTAERQGENGTEQAPPSTG